MHKGQRIACPAYSSPMASVFWQAGQMQVIGMLLRSPAIPQGIIGPLAGARNQKRTAGAAVALLKQMLIRCNRCFSSGTLLMTDAFWADARARMLLDPTVVN